MKEILYVLLNNYADHEMAFLSQAINAGEMGLREHPKYVNKIVAPTMESVQSVGGFRILPDYTFESMPKDYAALVLIGGYGWLTPEADQVTTCAKEAVAQGKIVGAICNAAAWMAKQGLLNHVKHTGNGLQQLQMLGGGNYTNMSGYQNEQAVSDKNIVTANGSGYNEFAREVLLLLQNDTPEMIERYYLFNKVGLVKLCSPQPRFKFNTIGLFTTNNKATVEFYTRTFGFTTDWNGIEPNVEMHLGDSRIILFPRAAFEQMVSTQFQYTEGFNGTMELAFDVPAFSDVDKEFQHALDNGAKCVMPPTTEPWGQRTCYVVDPDGNLIEIGSFVKD